MIVLPSSPFEAPKNWGAPPLALLLAGCRSDDEPAFVASSPLDLGGAPLLNRVGAGPHPELLQQRAKLRARRQGARHGPKSLLAETMECDNALWYAGGR